MRPTDLRYLEEPTTRHPWEPSYGLTAINRVRVAAALEAVRRRICAYGPFPERCDCKYGLDEALTVTPPPAKATSPRSEMTGCPELRSAIRMLLHPDEPPPGVPLPTPTNVRLAFARLDLATRALPRDLQQRVFELTEEIYQHGRAEGRAAPPLPTPARSEWLQTVAGEVREVQGRDLNLDGRDYLVTSERTIVEWLASYAHTLVENGSGHGPDEVCVCGWRPPIDGEDQAADATVRAHVDSSRADFVTLALARRCATDGIPPCSLPPTVLIGGEPRCAHCASLTNGRAATDD